MTWWRIQNERRPRRCDPHVDTLITPNRCPRLHVVDGIKIKDVSPLREARGHDNATMSYVMFTGEDRLEERSRASEGPIGPSRVTLKQTLRGLFPRIVRCGFHTEDHLPGQDWQHHEQHRD